MPTVDCTIRAVHPIISFALISAPVSRSSHTTYLCPLLAAEDRAVYPPMVSATISPRVIHTKREVVLYRSARFQLVIYIGYLTIGTIAFETRLKLLSIGSESTYWLAVREQ
jgi:hypothetical protein